MIKDITIENFQSHKFSQLVFHPGVNAIIGNSDCGKTAILRALNWVVFNRPSGDAFRSRFTTLETSVGITVDGDTEEITIGRSKGKLNLYILNGEEFKAFGNDVPAPIKNILSMSEINLQRQHDAPFLLSETAGEVGRRLNELIQLDVIDSTMSGINSNLKEVSRQVENQEARIEQIREEVKSYDWIEECAKEADSISKEEAELEAIQKQWRNLKAVISLLEEAQNKLESVRIVDVQIEEIEELMDELDKVEKRAEQIRRLTDLIFKIESNHKKLTELEKLEKQLKKDFDDTLKVEGICPLCGSRIGDK